jgi:FKBP-type peptidyl-prolyl cis-trans isomerase
MQYVVSQPNVQQTETGTFYERVVSGRGETPQPGDWLNIHLRGSLWSGEVFEDTRAEGAARRVRMDDLVPELQSVAAMMRSGDQYRVFLFPALSRSGKSLPGAVPPQTHVVYEIELVDFERSVAPGLVVQPISLRNE